MAAVKPGRAKEPDCIHSRGTQPASVCRDCQHDTELAKWRADWAAWLAENPDSFEAQWLARNA